MERVKVGIIGCGKISGIYCQAKQVFEILDIVACADLIPGRAKARAEEYAIPRVCSPEELLSDPEIELVVNLTTPQVHAEVCLAALEAGKHVYVEKPLGIDREEGAKLVATARAKGLRLGAAPDTFLGAGLQTCRKLIDDGWIGQPVAATAFMLSHGHETWHPDPEFYYRRGGGPMFDMGPYYLTALVSLIGPVSRVAGYTRTTFPQRTILSEPKRGQVIDVEVPTHVIGILDFAQGALATIVTSFDVWGGQVPRIEIYGTEGSLSVPDPNTFGGPVLVRRGGSKEWSEMPLVFGYHTNSRGLGVADMAHAIRAGRAHRANEQLAYHVLDVMVSIHDAADTGRRAELESTCQRPAPFPLGLPPGVLDD
ncbi:MAG: Gfo/Idh/MocA family protein [Limnochordia bacterium]|jgi:predicted dehydrogenase